MALSGSAFTAFADHRYVMEWSATQSIPNNNSTVTIKVYLQGLKSWSTLYAPASNAGSITCNGATQSFTATSALTGTQKKLLATKVFTVPHNADGTKSFNISTTYNINVTYSGVFHGNKTVTTNGVVLNTIPRTSTVSLSSASVNLGTATTINIGRASASFTHTLKYTNGGYSITIADKTGAISVAYTPSPDIANYMPNDKSRAGTITCETYSGATRIGTSSVSLTVNTVQSVVAPAITRVLASEANGAVTTAVGALYLKSLSRVTVETTSSLKNNATVRSISVSIGGDTLSGSPATSGFLKVSGVVPINVTLTDSRGYIATSSISISVLNYSPPTINSFDAGRNATDAFMVNITASLNTTAINSANTMGYKVEWQKQGDLAWTQIGASTSATQQAWSVAINRGGMDIGTSFRTQITVYDKFSSSTSLLEVPTATVPTSWGKTGIAVGTVYDENGATLQVRGSSSFDGEISTNSPLDAQNGFKPMVLPNGTDLNDVKQAGMYQVSTNASALTMKNLPPEKYVSFQSFSLFVEVHAGVKQTYTVFSEWNPVTFARNFYNGTWGRWYIISGLSGWQSQPLRNSINGSALIREINGVVHFQYQLNANGYLIGTGTNAIVCDIPVIYRPNHSWTHVGGGSSLNVTHGLRIDTTGEMKLWWVLSGGTAQGSSHSLNGVLSWSIASTMNNLA